ncbi:histidine phosphatase family protein [Candidatus Leptofilum sp.]|uniref:histidine phosphatase family protein n=1 Tax=Candidatus Leptofilum sp. TaxID=3241576 RepID=UPI003B5A4F0C
MKLYLARHGQSRWQIERNDNDWNSPLTELGQRQAQLLASWLAAEAMLDNGSHVEIGSIRVSPLTRARETAVPIRNALNCPIYTDAYLREADFYVSEHLPAAESPYQAMPIYKPSNRYAVFKQQARAALYALIADAETSGLPALGVAHGGLISTLLRLATGSDAVSFWLYNTSLNVLEWKRGRWHLIHLNLWDHLPPACRTF